MCKFTVKPLVLAMALVLSHTSWAVGETATATTPPPPTAAGSSTPTQPPATVGETTAPKPPMPGSDDPHAAHTTGGNTPTATPPPPPTDGTTPPQPSMPTGGSTTPSQPSMPTGGSTTPPQPSMPTGGSTTPSQPSMPTGGSTTPSQPSMPTGGGSTTPPQPSMPTGGSTTPPQPSMPTGGSTTPPQPSMPTGGSTTPPQPSMPTGSDNPQETQQTMGGNPPSSVTVAEKNFNIRPLSRPELIQTNKQVYYTGDNILVRVMHPKDKLTQAALSQKVISLQLLVRVPSSDVVSYPVVQEGSFFDSKIDTSQLPPGVYELGLVATKNGKDGKLGDATKLSDWYGGFSALLSVKRVKISDKPTKGEDPDDDKGGNLKGDTTTATDGFTQPTTDNAPATVPATK